MRGSIVRFILTVLALGASVACGQQVTGGGTSGTGTTATTYSIRGLTQGSTNAWNLNYGNFTNGSYATTGVSLLKSKITVAAASTLLHNNPLVASGAYVSGGSATGSGTCIVTMPTPAGGTAATATVPVSSGVITVGVLTITGGGTFYAAAPTSATLTTGTASSCSGTAAITSVLSLTPLGPYSITPVTATNPTVTFTVQAQAAVGTSNAGSLALYYACNVPGSAVDLPTAIVLTPISLTSLPTTPDMKSYQSAQAVTCTGTGTNPSDLYVWWTLTAPSDQAMSILNGYLTY